MCRNVLDSPADLWPPAFPGFRREARLTPGYARTAFQAEEVRPSKRVLCRIIAEEMGGGTICAADEARHVKVLNLRTVVVSPIELGQAC